MPDKPPEPDEEEILAMEISDDRRLREMGIDPDGDPIEIMMEVRRRAMERKRWSGSVQSRLDVVLCTITFGFAVTNPPAPSGRPPFH
jgi:hypothetical protein